MGTVKSAAKRRVRGLVDRLAAPYLQSLLTEVRNPVAAERTLGTNCGEHSDPAVAQPLEQHGNGTSDYFHLANHELRTIELERIPKGARRVLSVGANGRWYFDWFEKSVGVVEEHLGVEAYEPKPDDLPEYVTWIPDTADHMNGVTDSSVDVVFAGQTTEHLWSYELTGFLLEARRVLRSDGLLVLDSPNRLVTEHLLWSHGGHTVELSPDEISELVTLAGFDVVSVSGIWRCEMDGRRFQLEEALGDPAIFTRRASSARDAPDESFIWWLTARRSAATPAHGVLAKRTKQLFDAHWNTRVSRGLFPQPGAATLDIPSSAHGFIGRTLPFPLKPGPFEVRVSVQSGSWDDLVGFSTHLVAPGGEVVHRLSVGDAQRQGETLSWALVQPHLLFAISIELHVDQVLQPTVLVLPLDVRCDI